MLDWWKNRTTIDNSVFEDIVNQLSEIGIFEIRLGVGKAIIWPKKIIEKVKIARNYS